jgi:hypothetical protein
VVNDVTNAQGIKQLRANSLKSKSVGVLNSKSYLQPQHTHHKHRHNIGVESNHSQMSLSSKVNFKAKFREEQEEFER